MTTNQPTDSKINDIKNQVTSVTQLMKNNIESVLERGEKLENLENKTNELEKDARSFRISTRALKRHMCMKNAKMIAIIACIIIIIILIIIAVIYAGKSSTHT